MSPCGRDAIGIDLNPANRDLYPHRHAEVVRNLGGVPVNPDQLELWEER